MGRAGLEILSRAAPFTQGEEHLQLIDKKYILLRMGTQNEGGTAGSRSWGGGCNRWGWGLLVVRLYYHKSKKKFSMVQKSSVKKDALLPWSPGGWGWGRVGRTRHVFTPSPQSPPPPLQLPGANKEGTELRWRWSCRQTPTSSLRATFVYQAERQVGDLWGAQ